MGEDKKKILEEHDKILKIVEDNKKIKPLREEIQEKIVKYCVGRKIVSDFISGAGFGMDQSLKLFKKRVEQLKREIDENMSYAKSVGANEIFQCLLETKKLIDKWGGL